jgi:dephospho-CoA kinase
MAAQSPRAGRLRVANWIIDNSQDEAATKAQVTAAWPALREGPTPPPRNQP